MYMYTTEVDNIIALIILSLLLLYIVYTSRAVSPQMANGYFCTFIVSQVEISGKFALDAPCDDFALSQLLCDKMIFGMASTCAQVYAHE